MHLVRSERRDLRMVLGFGAAAIGFTLWFGSRELVDQVSRGVVTLPMQTTQDTEVVRSSGGAAVGFGGTLRPEVAADALSTSTLTMLRVGGLSTTIALSIVALMVALLATRVLRKGLFDPGTSRWLRLSPIPPAIAWYACLQIGNIGASQATQALDLPDTYWGTTGFVSQVGLVAVLYLLALAWVEVVLRAGRRLARDQEGII